MVVRKQEHADRNIVTETIFAGEQVKEFPGQQSPSFLAHPDTEFPRFPEYFLVGNRP